MSPRRYEISDEQWKQIKDMFPRARTPKDNRMIFNAILWFARSGAAWADMTERYEPHQSVYSRFCKWRDDGTIENIF
ncbi:MAG: transposase, partial [Lachnospiraceae bacterium]|nr:transposase [Lachnospiraceae bacterium]